MPNAPNTMDAFHTIEEVALMLGQGAKVECSCPEDHLIVRSGVAKMLNLMCEGTLEVQCDVCGKIWLYNLGDTFTLGKYRREVNYP